jgi:hypothetical protein
VTAPLPSKFSLSRSVGSQSAAGTGAPVDALASASRGAAPSPAQGDPVDAIALLGIVSLLVVLMHALGAFAQWGWI